MVWKVRFEQVGAISFGYVVKDEHGRYATDDQGRLDFWWARREAQAVADRLNGAGGGADG